MNTLILITTMVLGLSESIESRLPEDPGMIYTVGFVHDGVKVGLDWKNRQILTNRVCRKAGPSERAQCQAAATAWMQAECTWYTNKTALDDGQKEMKNAVCSGADALSEFSR